MNTKLVDKIFIEKDEIEQEYKQDWIDFLEGNKNTKLEESFQKVENLLKQDSIIMKSNLIYDNNLKACFFKFVEENDNILEINKNKISKNIQRIYKEKYKIEEFPSVYQLYLSNKNFIKSLLINKDNLEYEFYFLTDTEISRYSIRAHNRMPIIIKLVKKRNSLHINREIFFKWISLGLTPMELKDNASYGKLVEEAKNYNFIVNQYTSIQNIKLKLNSILTISQKKLIERLLTEDKVRADLKPYHQKILENIEEGHWSLWRIKMSFKNLFDAKIGLKMNEKLLARNPSSSIVDGIVGIDFGTKSTVVVYQKDSNQIYPMRVGTGNLSDSIKSHHYENPTIMEFNDLEQFINNYKKRNGRPYTKWEDLTISHTALNSFKDSKSNDYNSFVSDLKQWAGNKNKRLRIVDKKGYILNLPPFLELKKNDINPIEIYAYYLGLYINNQYNGIYLNYILSFPVTYEIEIREKIIESFKKGIKKSLPQELHEQSKEMAKLSVIAGASEPAAYAVIALQEYSFEPKEDEKVFYGVFDFGGGTTDFDFGIYREADGKKEKHYGYTIEHFGAGGDRYLGGENLLELLAFEVFKKNRDALLAEDIQFVLPPECNEFLGSEILLSFSREARMNTKTLMEKLRPFWEGVEEEKESFEKGILEVNLTKNDGTQLINFELDIDIDGMQTILYNRISKGVDNFFNSLRLAFNNHQVNLNEIKIINIFLAGNSSKSKIVKKIFKSKITKQTKEINVGLNREEEFFNLFEPLGNSQENLEKPTGKTGVAFGLLEAREGVDILVIDHNMKETEEINFKYYLGESRKKKFKVLLDRELEYGKWVEFIDASRETFELYSSTQSIVTTNRTPIDDSSIKKKILKIDKVDENAMVYIRLVNPTTFEYVVAHEDEINNENYIGEIKQMEISA